MSAENKAATLEKAGKLIQRTSEPPEEVIQLLEETFIGTNGAQYQLMNTRDRIKNLLNPNFFFLSRNNKAIGTITICERPILLNNEKVISFYIRYFAFQTLFQGSDKPSSGQNKFHIYFNQLFNTNLNLEEDSNRKTIFWAFIDPENLRSFKMREKFGFEEIGEFKTYIFQRFFPKRSGRVRKVRSSEMQSCIEKTEEFYSNHSLYSSHRITEENYFVLEKEGRIIAGIKTFPSSWKIKSLPGKNSKLIQGILPLIPFSKRLINPKNHKFLATEGFWYEEVVTNDEIEMFFEGILKQSNHHSIFLWEDINSKCIKRLGINWGMMEKIKDDNAIKIVAKLNNYEDSEVAKIKASPKYLSGFDMT